MSIRLPSLMFALLAPVAVARASVVLNDPFTEGPAGDTNLNDNLGRQSGSAAPSTYTISGSSVSVDGNLEISGYDVYASSDHNFNESGPLTMTFGMDPSEYSTASTNWLAFAFGMSSSYRNHFIASTDGIGLLIRDNGGVYVFDGATAISDASIEDPNGGNGGTDLTESRIGLDNVQINISGISAATPQTVQILINGVPVEFGPTDGSGPDTTTYTRAGGFSDDYTQFETLNLNGSFSNFTVASAVPEPAPLGLLGISSLLGLRRRAR